jgi:FkbM family methyltransferase
MNKGRILGEVVRTKFGDFLTDPQEKFVRGDMLEYGVFGEEEMRRLCAFIRDRQHAEVLIVGAHIGGLAIPLSYHCARLVAVEANPETFELLQANVGLNRRWNIALVYGAANETGGGEIDFWQGNHNSGGSKRKPVKARPCYVSDLKAEIRVPTVRLDDLYGETTFEVIHMDIEGSEPFALRGMQDILAKNNMLSLEFIHHHITDVAGMTAEEWLEPLRPYYKQMVIPARPWAVIEEKDWTRAVEFMIKNESMIPAIYFIKAQPEWMKVQTPEEKPVEPVAA